MKEGDLVRIKSGSSLMTIAQVSNDNVLCIWTNTNNVIVRETFPKITLLLEEEEEEEEASY